MTFFHITVNNSLRIYTGPSYFKCLLSEVILLLNDRVPLGVEFNTTHVPEEFVHLYTFTTIESKGNWMERNKGILVLLNSTASHLFKDSSFFFCSW